MNISRCIDIRDAELKYETSRELLQNQVLQKKYTSSWLWRSLSALIDVEPRGLSFKDYSRMLGVSPLEVMEAIDGLEKLGIIRREGEGYVKVMKYVYFSDRALNPQKVMMDHVLVSSQLLHRLSAQDPEQKSFYRTGFVATNEKLLNDFSSKMEALMKEFLEQSSREPSTHVVAFTHSSLTLTKKINTESEI